MSGVNVVDRGLAGAELLAAAAAEVASWPFVSASRARQVRWVAGEYSRALAHPDHPLTAGAGPDEVFTRGPVDAYLRLARTGELRLRRAADPARGSDNSEQTRLEVLRLLVTACGAEDFADLPPLPDTPRRQPVAERPRALLRTQLTELADTPGVSAGKLRMLAVSAVVSDTGIRAGELCTRTIEDLSPTLEELRVVRRPQGSSEPQAYTRTAPPVRAVPGGAQAAAAFPDARSEAVASRLSVGTGPQPEPSWPHQCQWALVAIST